MRRLLSFFLLMSMLCQSMAAASLPSASDVTGSYAANIEHVALHLEGIAHHHHDGGFHEDDSQEAEMHVLADLGLQSSAILPSEMPVALQPDGMPRAVLDLRHRPPPDPDGLKRPPRSHA